MPFRLTEINSVTCGGTPGVSTAFATALRAAPPRASPGALKGETFGGRRLNEQAEWVGGAEHETIPRVGDRYLVPIPAYSAALITLRGSRLR